MLETTANDLQRLRAAHRLRPLQPEEEGTAADRLPSGIYGFAYAPGEPAIPLFARKAWHSFEMHKRPDGTLHLVVFVTPREAELRRQGSPGEIVVFPDPWEDANDLVSIAMSQVIPSKRGPSREGGNSLKVTLL